MRDAIASPLAPSMDDDFGVGLRNEAVAERLQFGAHAFEVVDFAIEDDADRSVCAEHRLIAGHQIDDRQAPVTKSYAGRKEESFPVRSAMRDRVGHCLNETAIRRTFASCVKPAGYSTH